MGKLSTSAKTRPGADCGSDHELLIAIFRLKFKTVGKTQRKAMPKNAQTTSQLHSSQLAK